MNNLNKKDFIKDSLLSFLFCFALYVFFVAKNGGWYQFGVLLNGFVIFVFVSSLLFISILYILHTYIPKLISCFLLSIFSGILFLCFFKSSVLFSLGLYGKFYWITVAVIIGLLLLLSIFIGYKFQRKVNPFIIIFLFSIIGVNLIDFYNIVIDKYNIERKLQNENYRKKVEDYYQSFKKDANFKIRPNIYHIVLDTYPSNKILSKIYKIDNSNFYKELRRKGFKVYEDAYSNGADTYTTMSSIFSMKFFDPDRDELSFHGKNPAWGILFAGGYTSFCLYPCVQSAGFTKNIQPTYNRNYIYQNMKFFIVNYLSFYSEFYHSRSNPFKL